MWAFPAAAAAVSTVFAWSVLRGWPERRRPHLLAWGLALAMFALASGAAALGMAVGWGPTGYRVYYLFGAIANVPVLAVGTIYLLAPRAVGHSAAVIVAAAVVGAGLATWSAGIDAAALSGDGLPSGREVFGSASVRAMSRVYSIAGFVVVAGGALWSAWRLLRARHEARGHLVTANFLIALGTTVVAAASEVARVADGSAQGSIFGLGLFAGVSLMFAGFLRARTARPRT